MKLINNEAVDLIFAVKRFADRDKAPESNVPRMQELEDWCSRNEKQLSPFLLNDISLLFSRMILTSIYVFHMFRNHPGIETSEELIKLLESLTADELISFIKKELIKQPSEDITESALLEILTDEGLHPGYDPAEEASLLAGFLKDPDSLLKRLCKVYSEFREKVFLPEKKKLQELEKRKYEWHNSRISENAKDYLEMLGLHSFIKNMGIEIEPVIYFSLFADNEISSFWNSRTIVVGAGTDAKILHRSARDKADMFFTCFSEPKRLEILRLTSQKPWYSTELAEHFNLKPATLSYHLNILVDAELLVIEKGESRRFYYSVNKQSISEYLEYVAQDLLGLDYRDQ